VGLESTVLDLSGEAAVLLRPGRRATRDFGCSRLPSRSIQKMVLIDPGFRGYGFEPLVTWPLDEFFPSVKHITHFDRFLELIYQACPHGPSIWEMSANMEIPAFQPVNREGQYGRSS
jgi:hypothetical protein